MIRSKPRFRSRDAFASLRLERLCAKMNGKYDFPLIWRVYQKYGQSSYF